MISCMVKPQGYIIYKVIMTGLIHDIMHGQASRVVSHIMIMTGLVHDWIGFLISCMVKPQGCLTFYDHDWIGS